MPANPVNQGSVETAARQEKLRLAVEREYDRLCAGIAAMLCRPGERLEPDGLRQQVEETLAETVQRALGGAEQFDPSRPPVPWLMGIAARVLQGRRRDWARTRRVVPQTDLGKESWDGLLAKLSAPARRDSEADRIDLENALSQLEAQAREVIILRFYQGLDGHELAQALNLPSAGAARVRLCRALQTFRARFHSPGRLAGSKQADSR